MAKSEYEIQNRKIIVHGSSNAISLPPSIAEKYGFKEYAQPAGGCCFLTDASYSSKLADLWQARGEKKYEIE